MALDFTRSTRTSPRPTLGAGPRLLVLLALLGAVLWLMGRAGDPNRWEWFAVLGDLSSQPPRVSQAGPPSRGEHATSPGPRLGEPGQAAREGNRALSGLDREWFGAVRDDTVLRAEEHEAFFQVLDLLGRTPPAAIRAASSGEVTRVQLARQPAEYRGEVVSMRGTLRQALARPAASNVQGVATLYKLVVQPVDDPGNIVFVFARELPAGAPVGEQVEAAVRLDGVAYKRWAYSSQSGIRTAPLLLARSVELIESPPPSRSPTGMLTPTVGAVGLAMVTLLVLARWNRRATVAGRRFRLRAARKRPWTTDRDPIPPQSPEEVRARLAMFEPSSFASPRERLGRLAEELKVVGPGGEVPPVPEPGAHEGPA